MAAAAAGGPSVAGRAAAASGAASSGLDAAAAAAVGLLPLPARRQAAAQLASGAGNGGRGTGEARHALARALAAVQMAGGGGKQPDGRAGAPGEAGGGWSLAQQDKEDSCAGLYLSALRGYADVAAAIVFIVVTFGPLAALLPVFVFLAALLIFLRFTVMAVGLSRAGHKASAGALVPRMDISPTRFMATIIVALTNYSALHFFVLAGVAKRVDSHWPLVLVLGALFAASNPLIYAVASADPGIVKRQAKDAAGNDDDDGPPFTPPPGSIPPGHQWCATCGVARPPRAKHDSVNNVCIRDFDHACPIVNNAVGAGNRHMFLAYVSAMLTGQAIYLYLMALYLTREGEIHAATVTRGGWVAVADVLGGTTPLAHYARGCAVCPVGRALHWAQMPGIGFCLFLFGRHWYLAAANLTTNESINAKRYLNFWARVAHRRSQPKGWAHNLWRNPYDHGVVENLKAFFRGHDVLPPLKALEPGDAPTDGVAPLSRNMLSVLYYKAALAVPFLPLSHVVVGAEEDGSGARRETTTLTAESLGLLTGDASMKARMDMAQRYLRGELSEGERGRVVDLNSLEPRSTEELGV